MRRDLSNDPMQEMCRDVMATELRGESQRLTGYSEINSGCGRDEWSSDTGCAESAEMWLRLASYAWSEKYRLSAIRVEGALGIAAVVDEREMVLIIPSLRGSCGTAWI